MAIGSAVQSGATVVAGVAAARLLGPEAFGSFSFARVTVAVLATLASSGLSIATTRTVAALRTDQPERAGCYIGSVRRLAWWVGGASGAVCVLFAWPLGAHLLRSTDLAFVLMAGAFAITLSVVGGVQLGVLTGCEMFPRAAALLAGEGVLTACLLVLGAWSGGAAGAMLGFAAGATVAYFVKERQMKWAMLRADIRPRAGSLSAEWPAIRQFALPAFLLGLAAPPAEWLVRVWLARTPSGLSEVGVFSAAYSCAQLVMFMPMQIAAASLPIATHRLTSGDEAGFRRLIRAACAVAVCCGIAVALTMAVIAPWIMRAYGPRFASGTPALAWMALAYAIGSITPILRVTLLAAGRAWSQALHVALWGVVLVAIFLIGRGDSASGLAACHVVSFLFLVGIQGMAILRPARLARRKLARARAAH